MPHYLPSDFEIDTSTRTVTHNTGFRCSPDVVEWLGKRTMFGG
jgi:hypothetical protein